MNDYTKRLIEGVREQIAKAEVDIDGDKCIPSAWVDASILCDVVEKDIEPSIPVKGIQDVIDGMRLFADDDGGYTEATLNMFADQLNELIKQTTP